MLPILISIPHASWFMPRDIREKMSLSDQDIRRYSDLYTEQLYDLGNCPQVRAKESRLVADVNRAPDEIMMEVHLAHQGVVVQVAEDGKSIYHHGHLPTEEAIRNRVLTYHDIFHHELEKKTANCGFLIDGHSYKSIGPLTKIDAGQERADICLGNRGYTTCSREHTNFFHSFFLKLGYSVTINFPYDGGYVIGYHCHRSEFPGIQFEIKGSLYMNEATLEPYPDKIKKLNGELQQCVEEFCGKFFPTAK